jgi:hypothetical protein
MAVEMAVRKLMPTHCTLSAAQAEAQSIVSRGAPAVESNKMPASDLPTSVAAQTPSIIIPRAVRPNERLINVRKITGVISSLPTTARARTYFNLRFGVSNSY